MAVGWHRPTKLIIDTQAITENVSNEVKRMPAGTELFAVVKANGYGHGAVQTAKAAKFGGAKGFCVAILDEAIELRLAGLTDPILIMSIVHVSYINLLLKYDLAVTATSYKWLQQAKDILIYRNTDTSLKIHIKIDTGMGRIGFRSPETAKKAIDFVKSSSCFIWEGLYTHLSTADSKDFSYLQKQEHRFKDILSTLDDLPRYVHVSNSATAFWHQECTGNMIRYGIAMYGLNPSCNTRPLPFPLKPALSLISCLIHVKQLRRGEYIGYGNTYITNKNEWIGTVPIGYADGWIRLLQGFSVLVQGIKCEIIGRICMDHCMIRLPKKMAVGTRVTLIGSDHGETVTMQMIADKLATIHYEVACSFSERIPRIYK